VLDHYHAQRPFSVVIHGAAFGADSLAGEWAEARGIAPIPFPAEWENFAVFPCIIRTRRDGRKYNAAAGGQRNARMLAEGKPDVVIAFPGGSGTADMKRQARAVGVPVLEIPAA